MATHLTDEEKVRIRHHLGFLNVAPVATFVLGSPAAIDAQFIIESAMEKVLVAALPLVRRLLGFLDATENQRFEDQENLAVDRIGSIELREDEQDALAKNYQYWQGRLVNALGIVVNPYSKVPGDGGGGINSPVAN